MLIGKAHKFGDDIAADIHIFDKHNIFARKPSEDANREMATKMLSRLDPQFPKRCRPGDFIVAGRNFGMLSMYDQSAAIVRAAGIAAILAKSFDNLFARHAVNRGLVLVTCDTDGIETGDELHVDVEKAEVRCPFKGLCITSHVPHPVIRNWLSHGGVIEHLRAGGDF